ncbi:MAG: hypothetical protein CL661_00965, partial [Bacteroidetes bacterium]|nr:hypothetical protein [Bacteroidota bacterium]
SRAMAIQVFSSSIMKKIIQFIYRQYGIIIGISKKKSQPRYNPKLAEQNESSMKMIIYSSVKKVQYVKLNL